MKTKTHRTMDTYSEEQPGAEGYKPAPAENFTGTVYLKMLVAPNENTDCIVSEVLFEPGARTKWHTHGSNQILLIKEGVCLYQEEGKPIQKVEAGKAINIMTGIKHWHGASPDAVMIHTSININIEKGVVTWLEPVTDEQYST